MGKSKLLATVVITVLVATGCTDTALEEASTEMKGSSQSVLEFLLPAMTELPEDVKVSDDSSMINYLDYYVPEESQ